MEAEITISYLLPIGAIVFYLCSAIMAFIYADTEKEKAKWEVELRYERVLKQNNHVRSELGRIYAEYNTEFPNSENPRLEAKGIKNAIDKIYHQKGEKC